MIALRVPHHAKDRHLVVPDGLYHRAGPSDDFKPRRHCQGGEPVEGIYHPLTRLKFYRMSADQMALDFVQSTAGNGDQELHPSTDPDHRKISLARPCVEGPLGLLPAVGRFALPLQISATGQDEAAASKSHGLDKGKLRIVGHRHGQQSARAKKMMPSDVQGVP